MSIMKLELLNSYLFPSLYAMPAKKKSQNYYEISFIQINDNKT